MTAKAAEVAHRWGGGAEAEKAQFQVKTGGKPVATRAKQMSRTSKRLGRSVRVRGQVVAAAQVREQIVRPGDLRNEVGFQNDINVLLAALSDGPHVWSAAGPLLSPALMGPCYDDGPATITELKAVCGVAADASRISAYAA